jgi:hypothetical protein
VRIIAFLFLAGIALAQQSTTTSGQCSPIAPNNSGSVSIICSNIDKKLANQISQLVAASKRDEKALIDISDKLDVLLREQPSTIIQTAPGGINSVITGGNPTVTNTVINPRPNPRRIPPEKQSQCSALLARHHGSVSIMAIQQNDGEPYQFAKDWYAIFKTAEWRILEDRVATALLVGEPEFGILVKIHGTPVEPGGFVQVSTDSLEGDVFECSQVLQLKPTDIHAQRYLDTPEGTIFLQIGPQSSQR